MASKASSRLGKAVKAANLAIQAFGGYGYIDESPVQKFMLDARRNDPLRGTTSPEALHRPRRDRRQRVLNRLCRRRLVPRPRSRGRWSPGSPRRAARKRSTVRAEAIGATTLGRPAKRRAPRAGATPCAPRKSREPADTAGPSGWSGTLVAPAAVPRPGDRLRSGLPGEEAAREPVIRQHANPNSATTRA